MLAVAWGGQREMWLFRAQKGFRGAGDAVSEAGWAFSLIRNCMFLCFCMYGIS